VTVSGLPPLWHATEPTPGLIEHETPSALDQLSCALWPTLIVEGDAENDRTSVSAQAPTGDPMHAQAPASDPDCPQAQLAVELHPHVPWMHAVPLALPVQLAQIPELPHSAGCVPPWHMPPSAAEQQPPLHACDVLQAVVHACWLVSHA
jgi:hypothetical protein